MNRRNKRIIIWLVAVVIFIVILRFAVPFYFTQAIKGTNSLARYRAILNQSGYPRNAMVAHFPVSIPKEAATARFHAHPAFLQGGSQIILLLSVSAEELQGYIDKYSGNAIVSAHEERYKGMAISVGYEILPEDFLLIILEESIENHGYSCGLAVSELRGEIIFWSEDW